MLKTEAIKKFLQEFTIPDLAEWYHSGMEVQLNVSQDGGERIDGEFKGKKWHGWTDGLSTWKSFRIPFNANTEPHYEDTELKWDICRHTEAIGMTGWNWKDKCSHWVAFDFDDAVSHKVGLTVDELAKIRDAVKDVEWVTLRKSTSGRGLHIYVFVDRVPTSNHSEHAALGRAILGKLSAVTGMDLSLKVDACGGNMWVFHRKMKGTDGLTLLKNGVILNELPINWREHVKVISGKRKRTVPDAIEKLGLEEKYEEMIGQITKTALDDSHKRLISWLNDNDKLWVWESDNHLLITHTYVLKEAFIALNMKGYYDTISEGKNLNEQNCFCIPNRSGSWLVRRYSPGIQEHASWHQSKTGWTQCYFNREADFHTACNAHGGLEDVKKGFIFREAEVALRAAELLGPKIDIDPLFQGRRTTLKPHKDGRLVIAIEREPTDSADKMPGWLPDKDNWTRIVNVNQSFQEPETGNYDDIVRHVLSEGGEDAGWVIKSGTNWQEEPFVHIKIALSSLGIKPQEIQTITGNCIFKAWTECNMPFQTEYPGDRKWNRLGSKLRYSPTKDIENLKYTHWTKVLNNLGSGLDNVVRENSWCRNNGIITGADYLKLWIASLLQKPTKPLPYLFFYGSQNSGKSLFHESLSELFDRGSIKADVALTDARAFNAELNGAILCIVEEVNITKSKGAYNRIKDWVTAKELLIHAKGGTPYHVQNMTHWVQMANDPSYCPIFAGDSRIVVINVPGIVPTQTIPRDILLAEMKKEAPDFLAEVLNIEIPFCNDRLSLPVLATNEKNNLESNSSCELTNFMTLHLRESRGNFVTFKEFARRFHMFLGDEAMEWSNKRISKEIPPSYMKGHNVDDNSVIIANVAWKDEDVPASFVNFICRNGVIYKEKKYV